MRALSWSGLRRGVGLLLLLVHTAASATEPNDGVRLVVIMAAQDPHPALSEAQVSSIFRRKMLIDESGIPYVPVNLPATNPLRRIFSLALFKQTPEEMEAFWNEQYFQGTSPPFVLASTTAMLRFVATTTGAIGYVLECQLDASVKVVLRLPQTAQDMQVPALCPAALMIEHTR